MTEQPTALRLADLLAEYLGADHPAVRAISAELRRLHQFAEDQIGRATAAEAALQMTKATHALKIADLEAQRDALLEAQEAAKALLAQRDALLEALKELTGHINERFSGGVWDRARAAVRAVEEGK